MTMTMAMADSHFLAAAGTGLLMAIHGDPVDIYLPHSARLG